jgi:hypothetical protein
MSVNFCATLCRCRGVSGNQKIKPDESGVISQTAIFGAIDNCPDALASCCEFVTDLRRFGRRCGPAATALTSEGQNRL